MSRQQDASKTLSQYPTFLGRDVRFATILDKCRASRYRFPRRQRPLELARAERCMVSIRLCNAREGRCHPIETIEGLPHPSHLWLDPWLDRRYGHWVQPGSPLGVGIGFSLALYTSELRALSAA